MSRPVGEGMRRIEAEIAAEKAATLGRAGERLERALAEVAVLAERLAEASDPTGRACLVADHEQAVRRAGEARLALLIQREALGLRRHAVVDERFPEPAGRPPAGPPGR